MSTTAFEDLIKRFTTPDLFDMSREQLIQEVVWLRYIYCFEDTRQYMKRAQGGKSRGKIAGTDQTKYVHFRELAAKVILAKHDLKEKVTYKTLERDLGRHPDFSETITREMLKNWRAYQRENSASASTALE